MLSENYKLKQETNNSKKFHHLKQSKLNCNGKIKDSLGEKNKTFHWKRNVYDDWCRNLFWNMYPDHVFIHSILVTFRNMNRIQQDRLSTRFPRSHFHLLIFLNSSIIFYVRRSNFVNVSISVSFSMDASALMRLELFLLKYSP